MQEQLEAQVLAQGSAGEKPLPMPGALYHLDLGAFSGSLLPEVPSDGVLLLVMDDADFEKPAGQSYAYVVPWSRGLSSDQKGCVALDNGLGEASATAFLAQSARIHVEWLAKSHYIGMADLSALPVLREGLRKERVRSLLLTNQSTWSDAPSAMNQSDLIADLGAVMRHLSKTIPLGDRAGIRVSLAAAFGSSLPKRDSIGSANFVTKNDEFSVELRIVSSLRPGERLLHVNVYAEGLKGDPNTHLPISVRISGEPWVGVGRALVASLGRDGEVSAVIPIKEHDILSSVVQIGPAWRSV